MRKIALILMLICPVSLNARMSGEKSSKDAISAVKLFLYEYSKPAAVQSTYGSLWLNYLSDPVKRQLNSSDGRKQFQSSLDYFEINWRPVNEDSFFRDDIEKRDAAFSWQFSCEIHPCVSSFFLVQIFNPVYYSSALVDASFVNRWQRDENDLVLSFIVDCKLNNSCLITEIKNHKKLAH